MAPNGTLTNVDNVSDNATLELFSAYDVATAVVAGTTYLFVTGFNDQGLSVFSVAPNGTLTNVANVSNDATLELDGAAGMATAVVGGITYLFVTGAFDDGRERVLRGAERHAHQRGERHRRCDVAARQALRRDDRARRWLHLSVRGGRNG